MDDLPVQPLWAFKRALMRSNCHRICHRGDKLPRMKLAPTTQIAHLDGIWLETSTALRQCNIRTLQDLTLVSIATTPTEIPEQQLALLLEAAEVAGVERRER